MLSKSTILLSAVCGLLAAAAPALASEHNGQDHTYGGPVQTWCDVNPDCNGWNKGLHRASYENGAPAPAASPSQKQHRARRHGHEPDAH
jgi:hypothetical protein